MQGEGLTLAIVGLLLGVWLIGGAWAVWHGLAARRKLETSAKTTKRLVRLIETSPSLPAVVRADGTIEASDRFWRMLGLERLTTLTDLCSSLGTGIAKTDWDLLADNVRSVQKTGRTLSQKLSIDGSDRRFMARIDNADAQIYPNGAAVLWFFDLSETVRDLERLEEEAANAHNAFEALAGLIEASPVPMWHRGTDLRLSFVNQAYVDAVGGDSADRVVQEGIELLEGSNGDSPMAVAAKANQLEQPLERLVTTTVKAERRQLRVFDIPMGKVGIGGLAIDVQEVNEAHAANRRQAEAQRNLLDKMSAGVAQFAANRTLVFANLPFQRIFGFRDEWLAGKPEYARVLERMRENGKMPDARDFPEWKAERETWFHMAAPVEENWLLPDGTHLRLVAQPTPDGGLLLIFEDRTEQAQLASARDTLLRVRTATFDNLFETVSVFSGDGKLSIWNRRFSELWKLEEEYLAKHPRFDELLPLLAKQLKKPAHISILRELLQMTISNRQPRRSRIVFADERIFQLSTVPLPDGNALFAMLDVTDSMQIEQALRDRNTALTEADSIKGKFLANMSYEFRTPLTSIGGFADLLQQGVAGELPAQAKEYVTAISKSAERLTQQINAVLDYTQGEAGALPVARKPVELLALVNEVATATKDRATAQGATLIVDVKPNAGIVQGDIARLRQSLSAIVENAIDYGGEGVRVLIHAAGDRNSATIVVSDNGPGMDMQTQTRVLDDFLRSKAEGSVSNIGLGLPLARKLIELHGGAFELESKPGEGTTIAIRLPRTAPSS
ncbi:MAG: PAS-domain containing protein [Sphingorhabdus sp.]